MCGICGIIDISGRISDQMEREILIRRMLRSMYHRGPDHQGVYCDSAAALGVTRLSVLDRSAAGNQPMRSPTGRYVLVYNGEIYNYRSLRKSLEDRGEQFTSNSDTEVLLRLFESCGEACLHDLRGMFAFAVWDLPGRSLFLARDRIGEKPLVYTYQDGCFAFASEIAALLELPWVSRKPDWVGIHHGFHYVHIPPPHTAFEDISRLPPATSLEVDEKGLRFKRYWYLRFEQRYGPDDIMKCRRDICDELDTVTRLMSRSDVPVGTFLSGGLDSSTVTASLARTLKDFPTFRIGHPGPENELESSAAAAVASRFKTRHHEYTIGCDVLNSLHEFVAMHSEPTGTMVALDYYRLAREASRYVTVVLTGNGADELFGGYDLSIMENIDRFTAHWAVIRPFMQEPEAVSSAASELKAFVELMQELDATGSHLFYANRYLQRGRRFASEVYTKKMIELTAQHDPARLMVDLFCESNTPSLFNATTYQMLNLTCQYSLVDHSDVCGMASSLEVRSPFLDVRMMELAASIPPVWKAGRKGNGDYGKMILREAMAERLPTSVLFDMKRAFGTTVPYGEWLRSEWHRLFDRNAIAATGLFDVKKIDLMVQHDLKMELIPVHMLFNMLTLSSWCSQFQPQAP